MNLIILCVESDKKARTDNLYIDKAIRLRYNIDADVKLAYINLCGKSNYDAKKVEKEIYSYLRNTSVHKSKVIYCIDMDNYDSDQNDNMLNEKIQNFCKDKGYQFVWFCKNIEEVFLHKKVKDSEKVRQAAKFNISNNLCKATIESLSGSVIVRYRSNLYSCLDNYLNLKNL